MWLVDLDADGVTDVRLHELPALRGLSSLRGTLDELLGDEKYADAHEHYIEATLTDTIRPLDAMRRLRERFPYAVHVHWERPGGPRSSRLPVAHTRTHRRRDHRCLRRDVRGRAVRGRAGLIERALREVVGEPEVVEAGAAEVGAADIEPSRPIKGSGRCSPSTPNRSRREAPPMRLHRLRMTAFGPFAADTEIDFDALGADGLFLLHGQTGAGKTSVLDAVAFALFGRVPGSRQEGRRLHSDHADAQQVPEVELEATIGGRRMRIVRAPEYHRPRSAEPAPPRSRQRPR